MDWSRRLRIGWVVHPPLNRGGRSIGDAASSVTAATPLPLEPTPGQRRLAAAFRN